MPCVHICKVVDEDTYFGPYQFHIRWNNQYAYLHRSEYGNTISKDTVILMEDLLKDTRENHFERTGVYKGVPMTGFNFLNIIDAPLKHLLSDENKAIFMKKNMFEIQKKRPLIRGQISMQTYDKDSPECITSIIGNSQNDIEFSEEFDNGGERFRTQDISHSTDSDNNAYNMTYPLYEEALRTCETDIIEVDEFRKVLSKYIHDAICRKGNHIQNSEGTVLMNENLRTSGVIERRHKFAYER